MKTIEFELRGKTVVITGGAGFLAGHFASSFAAAGARVILADLSVDACREQAHKITSAVGVEASAVAVSSVDLADEADVVRWADSIKSQFGIPQIIVNNAAARSPGFFKPLAEFTLADWNQVVAVNMTGTFLVCRELGAPMAAAGRGSIINMSSIYGVLAPDQRIYEGSWHDLVGGSLNTPLVYSATKGAIVSMTRYLATYWGASGVRVNAIAPGGVENNQNESFRTKYSARVPLGRMGHPEEIASACLYLGSDLSAYITGQVLCVDGGLSAW